MIVYVCSCVYLYWRFVMVLFVFWSGWFLIGLSVFLVVGWVFVIVWLGVV